MMPSQLPSLREAIARNIDEAITRKGLTNREVGDSIGATEHQVWRWRRAKVKPSQHYLAALATVLTDGDVAQLLMPHEDVPA